MSKGLDAFNEVMLILGKYDIAKECFEELSIIEKELKDYEDEKRTSYRRLLKIGELVGQINENEKKLKALEIIKEHFVQIGGFKGNLESGKNEILIALRDLIEEQYDLLKEVLS